jgi:hypothetical protein
MKEMYDEIAQLLGGIAKALDMPDDQVAKAVEEGKIRMEMGTDERGERYIRVSRDGRAARLYAGAILHETAPVEDEDCGGGCSCGR